MTNIQQSQQQNGFFIKSINVAGPKIKVVWIEWRDGVESKHTIESSKTPTDRLLEALNSLEREATEAAGAVWMGAEVIGILLRSPEAEAESALKITIRGTVTDGNPSQSLTTAYLEPETYGEAVPGKLEDIFEQVKQYLQEGRNEKKSLPLAA
jgi:hypothetical protein